MGNAALGFDLRRAFQLHDRQLLAVRLGGLQQSSKLNEALESTRLGLFPYGAVFLAVGQRDAEALLPTIIFVWRRRLRFKPGKGRIPFPIRRNALLTCAVAPAGFHIVDIQNHTPGEGIEGALTVSIADAEGTAWDFPIKAFAGGPLNEGAF